MSIEEVSKRLDIECAEYENIELGISKITDKDLAEKIANLFNFDWLILFN